MTDTTTQGYEAETTDAAALFETLCGDILTDEPDPLAQYVRLTAEQVRFDALVSEIKRRRGHTLRAMADAGASYDQIARSTGLGGKQRVAQLIAPAAQHA